MLLEPVWHIGLEIDFPAGPEGVVDLSVFEFVTQLCDPLDDVLVDIVREDVGDDVGSADACGIACCFKLADTVNAVVDGLTAIIAARQQVAVDVDSTCSWNGREIGHVTHSNKIVSPPRKFLKCPVACLEFLDVFCGNECLHKLPGSF